MINRSVFDILDIFGQIPFISVFQHTNNVISIAYAQEEYYAFPKKLYPGGIGTRVFCTRGGCDVHCAKPLRLVLVLVEECVEAGFGAVLQPLVEVGIPVEVAAAQNHSAT
jgi:hypothetical protein